MEALPFLVVTRTTPLAARAPYIAAVAASFNTEIDSMSLGLISVMLPGIPSINIKASGVAPNDPTPRTRIVPVFSPGRPPGCVIVTPGICPVNADTTEDVARFSSFSASIIAIEPMTLTFFCVP